MLLMKNTKLKLKNNSIYNSNKNNKILRNKFNKISVRIIH